MKFLHFPLQHFLKNELAVGWLAGYDSLWKWAFVAEAITVQSVKDNEKLNSQVVIGTHRSRVRK